MLNLVEPLEVNWPPAHGTPSASAFEVTALYTPRTKLVAAAQLAARTSLVAHGALHAGRFKMKIDGWFTLWRTQDVFFVLSAAGGKSLM